MSLINRVVTFSVLYSVYIYTHFQTKYFPSYLQLDHFLFVMDNMLLCCFRCACVLDRVSAAAQKSVRTGKLKGCGTNLNCQIQATFSFP